MQSNIVIHRRKSKHDANCQVEIKKLGYKTRMKTEKFLTLEQARKILGVSDRSMYRFIESGQLKAYKIRYWRIKEKDLADFIENRSNSSRKK